MRKVKLAIVFLGLALIIFSLFMVVRENRVENQFPMWKPAPEEYRTNANSDVTLRFTGIDFDCRLGEAIYDRVLVIAENKSAVPVTFSKVGSYSVDFFYNGEWHMVFTGGGSKLVAYDMTLFPDSPTTLDYFQVTPGLFSRDGRYRIFIDGLGYADIDIIGIEDAP